MKLSWHASTAGPGLAIAPVSCARLSPARSRTKSDGTLCCPLLERSPPTGTTGTRIRLGGSENSDGPIATASADRGLVLILLDTTVLIDYLRGRAAVDRVAALQSRGDHPATSPINLEELARGLRPAEYPSARGLIRGLRILPIGAAEGWRAGEWRRDHAARGVTLSQADCLIGATALHAGATLATGNPRDFPMPDLLLEHWPVGG